MKIGWLVWYYDEDDAPTFHKDGEEPDYCFRKIRIVYSEVVE
jgi:hypothetical protein